MADVTDRMVEAAERELWMGGMRDVSTGVVRAAIEAALREQALQAMTDSGQEIEALLAQPAPEPPAWLYKARSGDGYMASTDRQPDNPFWEIVGPLYTYPPEPCTRATCRIGQRVPLTDKEIAEISIELAASHRHFDIQFARAIELAHGIGGEE